MVSAAFLFPSAACSALCLLDDLLRPQGALGHPFVVVSHPGYELVEAEVRDGGLQEEEGEEEEGEQQRQRQRQQQQRVGEKGEGAREREELGRKTAATARGAQIVFLPLSSSSSDSEDSGSD